MNEQKQSLSIPVAIVIAGALIAFGIYWTGRGNMPSAPAKSPSLQATTSIKPLQPTDYVLGDRKAKVVIIEYSDTECPFCKQFHSTLQELMRVYGAKGDLAWAFRYFPVHSKSIAEGVAQECAGQIGGNEAFWKYADKIFETTNSNDSLDLAVLPEIAATIGLDVTAFNACLAKNTYATKIEADRAEAINAGAQGTPYSVMFVDGIAIPLEGGALPYADMKNIIDAVLKNS